MHYSKFFFHFKLCINGEKRPEKGIKTGNEYGKITN